MVCVDAIRVSHLCLLEGLPWICLCPFNEWQLSVIICYIVREYLLVSIIDMTSSAWSSSTSSAYVDPEREATLEPLNELKLTQLRGI